MKRWFITENRDIVIYQSNINIDYIVIGGFKVFMYYTTFFRELSGTGIAF